MSIWHRCSKRRRSMYGNMYDLERCSSDSNDSDDFFGFKQLVIGEDLQ